MRKRLLLNQFLILDFSLSLFLHNFNDLDRMLRLQDFVNCRFQITYYITSRASKNM